MINEGDINSSVKQICTKFSTFFHQPIFEYQVSFYLMFDEEG